MMNKFFRIFLIVVFSVGIFSGSFFGGYSMASAAACSDGADNDNDGYVDYPADYWCTDYGDDDENGDNWHYNACVGSCGTGTQTYYCETANGTNSGCAGANQEPGYLYSQSCWTGVACEPTNTLPVGWHDTASCSEVSGWAIDNDSSGSAVNVQIFNGPASGGQFLANVTANQYRADVGSHAFTWTVPDSLKNNVTHQLYAYANDVNDGSQSSLLSGSPKSISCSPPLVACNTGFNNNRFDVCYFDGTSASTGATQALSTAIEANVPSPVGAWDGFNNDWGGGQVGNSGKYDSVSAIWRGRINFQAGSYVFHTVSDDGVELNIEGVGNVISNWTDHGPTQNDSGSITLSGEKNVQMRWYEGGGGAQARLWWDFTPLVTGECSSPATHNNCFSGTLGGTATYPDAQNPNYYSYHWWCNGSGGGSNQLCAEDRPVCSATTYACTQGTSGSNLAGHLNYSWNCSAAGETVSCSAPIPPPTNVTASCSADGTVGTVSWNLPSGYSNSYFRLVDNTASMYPPYWVPENLTDTGTSRTFTTTQGHNYTAWVHTRVSGPYNNGLGGYSSEVYSSSFTCPTPPPAPTCSSATPDGVTVTGTTHDVYINGVANATAVKAYVWSDVNGQDDLWTNSNGIYTATDQGGGVWKATIPFSRHPDYGAFNVHVYMESPGFTGLGTFCDAANFTRVEAVNGACGAEKYTCAAGTSVNQGDLAPNFTWNCDGINGGTSEACIAPIPQPTVPIIACDISGNSASASWTLPAGHTLSYFRTYDVTAGEYNYPSFLPETLADTGPSVSFPVTQEHTYYAWVHTRLPSWQYSTEVYTGYFTCTDTQMSGTLLPSPTSCEIALGASSCNVDLTWTTTNPQGVSAVTATGMDPVNGNNGSQSFVVPYGGRTFYLYNNAIQLATSEATATCVSGGVWNGTTCQAPAVLAGSLSGPNCLIDEGESSCNTNLSWSIVYPESTPTAITATGMEDINVSDNLTTPQSGQDPVNIPFPGRTFYLYNNAKSLHPTAESPNGSGLYVTARCENGIYWDGEKCAQGIPRLPVPDLLLEGREHDSAQSALRVLPGQNVTFTWNTYQTNSSTACSRDGGSSNDDWDGRVAPVSQLGLTHPAPTSPGMYVYTFRCTQDTDLGMNGSLDILSLLVNRADAANLVNASDSVFLEVTQMVGDPCEGASACSCEGSTCNCYSGQCLTISWECTVPPSTASEGVGFSTDIDGNGIGDTSGSVTFIPVASGEYSMQCNNGGGNGTPIMVNVKKKPIFNER